MFTGFNNYQASEKIEKLLSDKGTTIEDLLKEDDILDEFRNLNKKLIDFFDKQKVKHLLEYIIKEPIIDEKDIEKEENKNKGLKFPFKCSQIFALEIEEIFKYFFINNKQMKEQEEKDKKEKSEGNKNENSKEKKDINDDKKIGEKEGEKKEANTSNKDEPKKDEGKEEEKEKEKIKNEENKTNSEKKEEKEKENKKDNSIPMDIENEEENHIELLDYLFSFLTKDKEKKLNYVLCGYFSSIIMNILNVNPTVFLKYIYTIRKDVFNLLVLHCYRKSISDALSKILFYENYLQINSKEIDDKFKEEMNKKRIEVLIEICKVIDLDMDNEELNSIYFFITGLFDPSNIYELKEFFKEMINNKTVITYIITNPLSNLDLITIKDNNFDKIDNKRKNFMTIIDIIIFILSNIKKLKLDVPITESSDSKVNIKHTTISEEIFKVLEGLIKINFNKINKNEKEILQCFDEIKLSPLGEFKIKITDLITYLIPYFKKISNSFDQILKNSEYFKYGFDYIFKYEWNNIYQESFLSLLKSLFDNSAYHDLLANYLFNDLKIVNIIKSHIKKEDKFTFKKKMTPGISHGYISFLVNLCYKINTVIGGAPLGVNSNPSTEGSFEFIPKQNEENDKSSMFYGDNEEDDNKNKMEIEEEEKKGVPIKSMEKYLNDEWKKFFEESISELIKQYANKNWPERKKEMDLFDFLFQESGELKNDENNSNNENKSDNNEKNKKEEDKKEINNENKVEGNVNNNNEKLNINEKKVEGKDKNETTVGIEGLLKVKGKKVNSSTETKKAD